MFPKDILFGIDLYTVMLCASAIAAMICFRALADKRGIEDRLQNLVLVCCVACIAGGYVGAVATQGLYNIPRDGGYVINSQTGATFYGGLVVGAVIFLATYFVGGRIVFKNGREHVKDFWTVAGVAPCCITLAHGIGRIGCLMAGCCHGATTDAWYGVYMTALGKRVVPIQLFEALFLFGLCALLCLRAVKSRPYNLSLYLFVYGIWRFFIEYAREDYRGYTWVEFLSPSQLTSLVLIVVASVVIWFEKRGGSKREKGC